MTAIAPRVLRRVPTEGTGQGKARDPEQQYLVKECMDFADAFGEDSTYVG